MKNYHLATVHHDNIDCIHIKFNGGEEMYIPVEDIQAAIEQHQQRTTQPPKRVMKRAVVDSTSFRNRLKGDLGEEYPHD